MKIVYLLLIYLNLSASIVSFEYVGELSFFGKVAEAAVYYENDGEKYHIKVSGTGSGIIGYLTQHRQYVYESIGIVKDNQLIPMKYIGTETSQDLNKTKTYTFDYKNHKTIVTQYKKERKYESTYNVFSLKLEKSSKIVEETKIEELDEIYDNDMVSVLFNKRNDLLSMKKGDIKLIHAVGSEDTQDGIIIKLIKNVDEKYMYMVTLEKDYLEGGSEDVTFILDNNNILFEAKVDGIFFFGNASLRRITKKTAEVTLNSNF